MFSFNIKYFVLTLLLFAAEIYIGLYVHDAIVRPYVGDMLVVILLYCLLKSFITQRINPVAIGVLLFAYAIEISQYFNLINVLGLAGSKIARLILGTTFGWTDMLMYTLGIIVVLTVERIIKSI